MKASGMTPLRHILLLWTVLATFALITLCTESNTVHAQNLSTLRLEIRKAEVVNERYRLFFSFLDANQRAIKNPKLDQMQVLLADRELQQKGVSISKPELKLLADSNHSVAVMFVLANYRAFTNKTTSSVQATAEFISKMRPNDVAGVVYYGDSFRDLPFTYDMNSLSEQVQKIKPSKEAIPRFFAALGNAVRRCGEGLDVQKVDKTYLVILTDGHGTWEGASQPQAVDRKIKQTAERLKELNITPIIIGYSPTLPEEDPSLDMLQQLAVQSRGTYRHPLERDEVFGMMEAAYNEIYGSHVLSFKNNSLDTGQNHKLRVQIKHKGLEAKSPPATVYVPTPEGIPKMWWYIGGGVCLVFGLFGLIGLFGWLWWKKRKEAQELEDEGEFVGMGPDGEDDGEFSDYDQELAGLAPVPGAPVLLVVGDDTPLVKPPSKYYASLRVTGGPLYGNTYFMTEERMIVGSAPLSGNEAGPKLVVKDRTISKRHAGIKIEEDGRYELHDLGSTNGVFVNDQRISHHFLKDGSRIKMGDTEFIFNTFKKG